MSMDDPQQEIRLKNDPPSDPPEIQPKPTPQPKPLGGGGDIKVGESGGGTQIGMTTSPPITTTSTSGGLKGTAIGLGVLTLGLAGVSAYLQFGQIPNLKEQESEARQEASDAASTASRMESDLAKARADLTEGNEAKKALETAYSDLEASTDQKLAEQRSELERLKEEEIARLKDQHQRDLDEKQSTIDDLEAKLASAPDPADDTDRDEPVVADAGDDDDADEGGTLASNATDAPEEKAAPAPPKPATRSTSKPSTRSRTTPVTPKPRERLAWQRLQHWKTRDGQGWYFIAPDGYRGGPYETRDAAEAAAELRAGFKQWTGEPLSGGSK